MNLAQLKTESQEPPPETMRRTESQPSKKVGFHEFSRKKKLSIPRAEVVNYLKQPSLDPGVYPTDLKGAPSTMASG